MKFVKLRCDASKVKIDRLHLLYHHHHHHVFRSAYTVCSLKLQHNTVDTLLIEQTTAEVRQNSISKMTSKLTPIRHIQPCPHSLPTPPSGHRSPYVRRGAVPRRSRPVCKKPSCQLSAHPRRLQFTGESTARVTDRHVPPVHDPIPRRVGGPRVVNGTEQHGYVALGNKVLHCWPVKLPLGAARHGRVFLSKIQCEHIG